MKSDKLYRVQREDLPKLEQLLSAVLRMIHSMKR